MFHIVIPIELNVLTEDSFSSLIETMTEAVFSLYAPSFYIVKFKGTSKELAHRLGIGEFEGGNQQPHVGLVIPFTKYYGYASASLWEWMEAHGEG